MPMVWPAWANEFTLLNGHSLQFAGRRRRGSRQGLVKGLLLVDHARGLQIAHQTATRSSVKRAFSMAAVFTL